MNNSGALNRREASCCKSNLDLNLSNPFMKPTSFLSTQAAILVVIAGIFLSPASRAESNSTSQEVVQGPSEPMSVWFVKPAKSFHESCVLGNGRLGAMDMGGVDRERIILNESSVWTGGRF